MARPRDDRALLRTLELYMAILNEDESPTIRLDKVRDFEDIMAMIDRLKSEVPRFTDHELVDLQVRHPEFHEDMKKLREASRLLGAIIDKMRAKAERGDYLEEDRRRHSSEILDQILKDAARSTQRMRNRP